VSAVTQNQPLKDFGDKETLCRYWPLGTLVITGPKALEFYAGFCAHGATYLKADGEDISMLRSSRIHRWALLLSGEAARPLRGWFEDLMKSGIPAS
jgi:hypothetical protein